MLEKTLESPWTARRSNQSILKEISSEYSFEGLMLEAESPLLWPPDVKNCLIRKDPDSRKDWSQEEKGTSEATKLANTLIFYFQPSEMGENKSLLFKHTHTPPKKKEWRLKLKSSPLRPVHSKGDQSWVFCGRTDAKAETPVLWPPHAKS